MRTANNKLFTRTSIFLNFPSFVYNKLIINVLFFQHPRHQLRVHLLAIGHPILGVGFHDGGTLEAHDVAYSLRRQLLQSDPTEGVTTETYRYVFTGELPASYKQESANRAMISDAARQVPLRSSGPGRSVMRA